MPGKAFRRTVTGIPTAKFRDRLAGMARHAGLSVIAVDPAYTSKWGAQHWLGALKEISTGSTTVTPAVPETPSHRTPGRTERTAPARTTRSTTPVVRQTRARPPGKHPPHGPTTVRGPSVPDQQLTLFGMSDRPTPAD
jgi:hypothetical protein